MIMILAGEFFQFLSTFGFIKSPRRSPHDLLFLNSLVGLQVLGNLRFPIGLIPKTFWVISTFLIHQFFFRGLKQGKKGSKRVLVFMFQNINYAKSHKQESKKKTKTDMIQINISNKITFLNYWNSTISNKILATKPQL